VVLKRRIIARNPLRRASMRPQLAVLALSVITLAAPSPQVAAESTRTLRLEMPGGTTSHITVENLAGSMRVAA